MLDSSRGPIPIQWIDHFQHWYKRDSKWYRYKRCLPFEPGFYCVDNMPMELLPKFLDLPLKENPEIKGLAFVMDMRSKNFISNYAPGICAIEGSGFSPEIIFLEADVDTLMSHIHRRGRDFERNISADYLGQLNQLYTDWIEDWTASPILCINMNGRDFQHNPDDFNYIAEQVQHALKFSKL